MRIPIIAGNWKMNKTVSETKAFFSEFIKLTKDVRDVEIIIAPPFTALSAAAEAVKDTKVKISAQDMFWEEKGAYTGEISPLMLKEIGCSHCIIGHSERRQYFGETEETVNKKIKTALKYEITPVFCIGEILKEREENRTMDVINRQMEGGLKGLSEGDINKIVIAYEPVWAIGTGKTATPAQVQEVHRFIRDFIRKKAGDKAADGIRILYGGSVTPENINGLMAEEDIDGALVGGASLKPDSFAAIVRFSPLEV
ncbi:MAG: triose-phosphate isomerase [Nitrospirae bacterium]|nr:triose-phosphate isomerase [Nitrospirota bacterium]